MKTGNLVEISRDVFGVINESDDSVYGGYGANQGFVVLENSVLVFDSGFSISHASSLDRTIKSTTDKKVRYLVHSHDHSDHIFGNIFFWRKYRKNGIEIISHANCKSQIKKQAKNRLRNYRSRDTKLNSILSGVVPTLPSLTYSGSNLKLTIDELEFCLIHPVTGAHTLGDTMLAIPQRGAIFAGDILWNMFLPDLQDANLEGWIDTLENLDLQTYSTFLPGHGKICGKNEANEFLGYLRVVKKNLLSVSRSKERDAGRLRECFAIEGTEKWKFQMIVDHNIQSVFGSEKQIRTGQSLNFPHIEKLSRKYYDS